jgi:hypothetical protein
MAKYKKDDELVDAEFWNPDNALRLGKLTEWLKAIGALYTIGHQGISITLNNETVSVVSGDWIILDSKGNLSTQKPSPFFASYKAIPQVVDISS